MLPDGYEVGQDKLDDNLRKVFGISSAADACLLEDIHAQECIWTFRLPDWSNPEVGQHVLRTPYGALTVQRFLLGWTVHRNATQLVWFRSSMPVVFCNLQDAKLAALVHMHDYGCERFVDGTRWAEGRGQVHSDEASIRGTCWRLVTSAATVA